MADIKRYLQKKIENSLRPNRVVMIFGARRVGKTVLMRQIINDLKGKYYQ
jgi:predicted AAA+ superfamily ATPase